ncbi:MAG: cold shock domain-containing protein [bacterium]
MMKGTIKKIMEKGFGFIAPEEGGKDIFFHSNSLVGVQFTELREGDAVTFETEDTEKGKNAINVQRA